MADKERIPYGDRVVKAPYDGDCIACTKPYVFGDSMQYIGGRLCHFTCRQQEAAPIAPHCPVCQAPVIYVVTDKNITMPLDMEPGGPKAVFKKVRVDERGQKLVTELRNEELEAHVGPLYTSHLETCRGEEVSD